MTVQQTVTKMTSREFNQDTAKAKRAALRGPVMITDRGRPSHVLLSKDAFDRLERGENQSPKPFMSLAEALAQTDGGDFDFDIPEFKGPSTLRIPDLD